MQNAGLAKESAKLVPAQLEAILAGKGHNGAIETRGTEINLQVAPCFTNKALDSIPGNRPGKRPHRSDNDSTPFSSVWKSVKAHSLAGIT